MLDVAQDATTVDSILALINSQAVQFVDLRFSDTLGVEQHMTLMADQVDAQLLQRGKLFDGSSIKGWRSINCSDMLLKPDCQTAKIDPFYEEKTLLIRCNVYDPLTEQPYARCPRSLAQRAEQYLNSTGIADACFFGPEPEFFLFDDVRWQVQMDQVSFQVDSAEAVWNSSRQYPKGNHGHRPGVKGGYFPVPPVDSSQNIRSAICQTLKRMGQIVELHHHEVATGNQNEISTRFDRLLAKADAVQEFKYVVRNIAKAYDKTATFMPKPLVGDNGSGMHCHQSLALQGKNLFAGDAYAGLSEMALFYIGGIIRHAPALNAFTNPTTNSYKRLVPGFEAPEFLAYSRCNRSAAIRVPFDANDQACRIEVRFPDPTANPYLAFAALLMAGLDGIQNKIHPGEALEEDLFHIDQKRREQLPTVARSLDGALDALANDQAFLCQGGVFSQDMINAYITLKMQEVNRLRCTTHPVEFELYWSN